MPPEIKDLVEANHKLLEENNRLLKKLYRYQLWGTWLTLLWYALIIGAPFALYFYVLEPYFSALGASYDTFYLGMQEIPGFKQFQEALEVYKK